MDATLFTSARTGRLTPVTVGQPDWAFIPDPLPRKWHVPNEMWPMLADAKAELARLDGIGRTLPNPLLLLRPLQRREAIRSSSLEGTYASAEELLLFELQPREPSNVADRANDWLEVSNYGEAVRTGVELLGSLPLSLRLIRLVHERLLRGVRGRDRAPGEFRRNQVHVGPDRRYVPPPPHEVPACLDDLEKFLHDSEGIDPLVRAFMAHYQFEAIHPFIDGNGRVGRTLLALCAYAWCGLSHPWLYLSAFFERHKDEYVDRLFSVSADGAWEPWLELCLLGTIEECRDATRRCDALVRLRQEYHARFDRKSGRMHLLIETLFADPIITIPTAAARCSVQYPTAKTDITRLMQADMLRELPGIYPRAFFAPEIMAIAFHEP